MKITKLALALTGLCAATAFAAGARLDDQIGDLNAAVADLLEPYQTDVSKAALEFQSLVTDDNNVLSTRLTGAYQRVGKVQTMDVRVDGLTYDFASGSPIVNVAGSAAFDLTQVFQRDQLNGLVDGAEGLVEDLAGNYTKDYGAAATVKGTMIEKTKDASGNYTAFRASVAFRIDMSKLPEGKKSEDIALLSGVVFFRVDLSRSIDVAGTVMLNPAYKNYGALKTELGKLLGRDEDTGKKITQFVEKLDKMAGNLVDAQVK
jgi:hypothetical protein